MDGLKQAMLMLTVTFCTNLYFIELPEYVEQGVPLSHFSYQIPKHLQGNYVRNGTARVAASQDPDQNMSLQLG
ncbi:hypothetical protein QVD17_26167 [Tagetes erecta]|uniref:Uncharacterized protein n=1 Tax=Tagetes erecta TaxID=13708 RepID=A0AAD8NIB9_TARER|nr:hypothetical protein QVD17_26167 [Tagetes erecta]